MSSGPEIRGNQTPISLSKAASEAIGSPLLRVRVLTVKHL